MTVYVNGAINGLVQLIFFRENEYSTGKVVMKLGQVILSPALHDPLFSI